MVRAWGVRRYTWSAVAASDHSVANLTQILAAANTANGGAGAFRVLVPSEAMVPGATFAVSLTAENFLGNSHMATTTVRKTKAKQSKTRESHTEGGESFERRELQAGIASGARDPPSL